MRENLNRLIAANTFTNYLLITVRVLQGILLTRWLFHYLGAEYYGFWSILWAFFAYMALFNLGFGAAAQKYTAEKLFDADPKKFDKIISSVFVFYCAVALFVCAVVYIGAYYLPYWTGIYDPVKIAVCRTALIVFGTGTAAIFPLAIFSDILNGLKLIYIKNGIFLLCRLLELFGILTLVICDCGFIVIVAYCVCLNVLFNAAMFWVVKKYIPTFKLTLNFTREIFAEIFNFSLFAYINSIGRLIINKTDRFVLGAISGMPAVGSYQLATRTPEISLLLSSQFLENVMPLSAALIHSGDTKKLSQILLSGMRFCMFVSFGLTAILYTLAPETIFALFGVQSAEITQICRIFLISQLVLCVVGGVPSRYLLMAGRHKYIAVASILEAFANILLSIYLCLKIGILGVAWGTLIPNVFFAFFVIAPPAIRALRLGLSDICIPLFNNTLTAIVPITVCLGAKAILPNAVNSFFTLACVCSLAMLLYTLTSWKFSLSHDEKNIIMAKAPILQRFVK